MPRGGGKPVTIRGVTYPSRAAASRELSVRRYTLWRAEREGWLDNLGLRKARGETGRLWYDGLVMKRPEAQDHG